MPELKRTPTAGIMNLDVTDEILNPTQLREALDINIGESESSDLGKVENLLGNEAVADTGINGGVCLGAYRDNGNERIYFFITTNVNIDEAVNEGTHAIFEYDQTTNQLTNLTETGEWLNFHVNFRITGINLVDGLLFWTDDRNEPRKINVERARNNTSFYNTANLATVAKFAPFKAPTVGTVSTSGTSNFLENKLPRFAYRYKFNDGELSTISPFTPIVFVGDTEVTLSNLVTSGEIASLVNQVKQVPLNIPIELGVGITEVEVLYKEAGNTNVYILDNVIVEDSGDNINFTYNSQDPFRTLPSSQVTRVYDAVPRRAKSQEIAGGRIVYGNYLQNYDLPTLSFRVEAIDNDADRQSIKSRRTYQVGVVLADEFGRQSPVILSGTGNDTVFVNARAGKTNIAQKLQVTFLSELPSWAHSYRIVVKQREQEYYNVFTSSSTAGMINRSGDTINKVPYDSTQAGSGDSRPTDVFVYPKVLGGVNQTSNSLIKVQSINNSNGIATLDGAVVGNVVYETEPFESALDIFYETSTGALVPEDGMPPVTPVDYYNCYILDLDVNAHVEVNRLRAGFNEPFFDFGIKAYIVDEDFAGEERRFNTLIHSSGLFNSRTGINQINQFNEGEGGLTLSLDPSDGSIQKLYAEDTQLIIWQEDKVSRSPINKDFIYSAEGGAVPVTSNTQYLGTVAAFPGEYGISTDPGSFAVYGQTKYFTDRNRGVVLSLSPQGLQEISKNGLSDFYRDIFITANTITGSFDEYHDQYNLTVIGEGYASNEDTNIATVGADATGNTNYFTISYSTNSGGWSSFKSFDPEAGLTLNNRYYTFQRDIDGTANIWLHNSRNVARNSFYARTSSESYVEVIFNDGPSSVKDFKTLGYEGSDGWICESIVTDLVTLGDVPQLANTFNTILQTGGTLTNATVTGARAFIRPDGAALNWTLVYSPVSSLYEFTDVNNVDQYMLDTDLTSSELDTIPTPTLSEGRLILPIGYTINSGHADANGNIQLQVVVNGQAPLAPTGTLLTITLVNNIENTELNTGIITLLVNNFIEGSSPIDFIIQADETYYIEGTTSITAASDDYSVSLTGVIGDVVGDNLEVTGNINAPTTPADATITIEGNALSYSFYSFESVVPTGWSITGLDTSIDPFREDTEFSDNFTVTFDSPISSGDINDVPLPTNDGGLTIELTTVIEPLTSYAALNYSIAGTLVHNNNRNNVITVTAIDIP